MDLTEARQLLTNPVLTVDQTARVLGISRDAVYDGVARGELHAVRVGRLIRIAAAPIRKELGLD